MGHTIRMRLAYAATSAVLLGAFVACGGDDDAGDGSSKQQDAAGDLAGGSPAAGGDTELAAYCSAELTLEATSVTADFEGDPVGAAESLLADAEASRDVAPADVAPLLDEGIAMLEGVVESGDPAAFETFDSRPLHAFDLENCGWEVTDVTAKDYAFEGLPAELEAGTHSFEITNEGAEVHVMAILTRADRVQESWDDILAAGEDSGLYEEVATGFAPPGGKGYAVADLAPGEYMVLCPIPTGTTGDGPPAEGPPHFTHGMQQVIRVT